MGIHKYAAKLTLRITAEAYDEEDLLDLLSDVFSPGDQNGLTIEKCEVGYVERDDD
jgi:hypothetical protein